MVLITIPIPGYLPGRYTNQSPVLNKFGNFAWNFPNLWLSTQRSYLLLLIPPIVVNYLYKPRNGRICTHFHVTVFPPIIPLRISAVFPLTEIGFSLMEFDILIFAISQSGMSRNFIQTSISLDFLCGYKEKISLSTNCIVVFNGPKAPYGYVHMLKTLSAAGFPVDQTGLAEQKVFHQTQLGPPCDGCHFVQMTRTLTFSLRPSLDKQDRPFCSMIPGTEFSHIQSGKQKSYFRTMAVSPGPFNFFKKVQGFNICFQVSLPPTHTIRRNDAFAMWTSFTNFYMDPYIKESTQMNVSSTVLFAPLLNKDGSFRHDRFIIGTYGLDSYEDVVISTLFGSSPLDPSMIVINSQIYHYMVARPITLTSITYPQVNFGIEIQIIRCSSITLDYVRDLLLLMGVPVSELLDITFEGNSIIIYCRSIHSASYIMERYASYIIHPSEWMFRLRTTCKLRTSEDITYTSLSDLPPLGDYPGPIFSPIIEHNVISPVSLTLPPLAQSQDPKKEVKKDRPYGPTVASIIISPRLTTNVTQIPLPVSSSVMTMSALSLKDSRGTKRSSRDMEIQIWLDILGADIISDAQIELLINTIRNQLPNSPSLYRHIRDIVFASESMNQTMEVEGDDKS
jgi:hypothetical protein